MESKVLGVQLSLVGDTPNIIVVCTPFSMAEYSMKMAMKFNKFCISF